jgi:hypothetical protein
MHPKAKLAPCRYRPFKVIWASPTNCKLDLPSTMRIHPVFHNSLLKPYTETKEHGPNYARPPPEIVEGEEGHYEIELILASRPTRNRKSTQYLVKWKGYPDSENSWIPAKELTHAQELLKAWETCKTSLRCIFAYFQEKDPSHIHRIHVNLHKSFGPVWEKEYGLPTPEASQVQWGPKEGILSQAQLMPSQHPRDAPKNSPSPPSLALKLSYSKATKQTSRTLTYPRPTCDH